MIAMPAKPCGRTRIWSPRRRSSQRPTPFLTLRRAAAEEDADIDAALNSLLDGTLGWADGLEPGDEASAGSDESSSDSGESDDPNKTN